MRANATDGEKLEEALLILAIAFPGCRKWTNEKDEVKLRIYRNLSQERVTYVHVLRNEINELRATIKRWEESV